MKKIVCLYGGPGTGKSTTAAALFASLKYKSLNVELVREYIKDWVWEGRKVLPQDQFYLLAKQARKEKILFEENDYIITDSPLHVGAFFEQRHEQAPFIAPIVIQKHHSYAKEHGFEHVHVFLKRIKPYNSKGRFETEEQAQQVDKDMAKFLTDQGVFWHNIVADTNAPGDILKILGL
jgi:SpoVK/Ycf46/Vps4 family AAA+-type ATPase